MVEKESSPDITRVADAVVRSAGFNAESRAQQQKQLEQAKAMLNASAEQVDSLWRPVRFRHHASDCAVHNEPALPVGPCSCGYQARAERRYVAWLCRLVCSQALRWKTRVRSWWWRVCR